MEKNKKASTAQIGKELVIFSVPQKMTIVTQKNIFRSECERTGVFRISRNVFPELPKGLPGIVTKPVSVLEIAQGGSIPWEGVVLRSVC